jgi:molybdopterin molybdotransferase
MIPFQNAFDLVVKHAPRMEVESCRLEDAADRVLRREIRADRDFPPFDRVMMDGFAMRAADLEAGGSFRITGCASAGEPRKALLPEPRCCVEVMTGAPVPDGADCIVPVERTARGTDDEILVTPDFEPRSGLFIHRAGSDCAAGTVLLRPGTRLGSRESGVAASCGAALVDVSRQPRITIVPTGNELVPVRAAPAPHQIRQSNGHAIRAALRRAGFAAVLADPLGDEAGAACLRPALESSDWLIITGAISMGARDFIPALLDSLGCARIFHGVAQRPGKPAGCWTGARHQIVMALPGNPVSALTGLHAFVLPALAVASGMPLPRPRLVIPAERADGLRGLSHHLPVTLGGDGRAHPAPTGNSGDFIGLLKSDGFVTLPPQGVLSAALPFTPWL